MRATFHLLMVCLTAQVIVFMVCSAFLRKERMTQDFTLDMITRATLAKPPPGKVHNLSYAGAPFIPYPVPTPDPNELHEE